MPVLQLADSVTSISSDSTLVNDDPDTAVSGCHTCTFAVLHALTSQHQRDVSVTILIILKAERREHNHFSESQGMITAREARCLCSFLPSCH